MAQSHELALQLFNTRALSELLTANVHPIFCRMLLCVTWIF